MADSDPFANFKPGSTAYQSMTKEEIEKDMDARYGTGQAYHDTRLWVFTYHDEVERKMASLISKITSGKDLVELGCGGAGVAAFHVNDARKILATDLSDAALQLGRDFFKNKPELEFKRLDAEAMDLPDSSVDILIAKEVIEHLPNPTECLAEISRVLRPGGLFMLSTPNRDSLHLRLNRLLGGSDFFCSGDHQNEFRYSEMVLMLAEAGLEIAHSEGVLLMPYHYVAPVFPPAVDKLENESAEFVDLMKDLGRRAGPEYAFGYLIVAAKGTRKVEGLNT